jgi:alkylation response protein AidB-like acyl-CoA dehydrogenase
MMTLVVVTRLHNAAIAAAGMRRGLDYARAYARTRTVAGGALSGNPLHRATLGTLAVHARAAFSLAGHGFALLGQVETAGDPRGGDGEAGTAAAELRLVAPLAKLVTGKLAVASASEYVECFGGAGYVEDTGVPRLLRDAQVLPIWEGTTNVLSVDVLRAVAAGEGTDLLLDRISAAAERAAGWADHSTGAAGGLPEIAGTLRGTASELREQVTVAAKDPTAEAVLAQARGLAVRLGEALAAALLVEHAGWAIEHGDPDAPAAAVAATLWTRHRLAGVDIAHQAHRAMDIL